MGSPFMDANLLNKIGNSCMISSPWLIELILDLSVVFILIICILFIAGLPNRHFEICLHIYKTSDESLPFHDNMDFTYPIHGKI